MSPNNIEIVFFFLATCRSALSLGTASPSGLYADNGLDQSTAQRLLTAAEKHELESEFLTVLRLSDRPRRIARKASLVKRSAPKFLLHVYKNILSGAASGPEVAVPAGANEFNFTTSDIRAINDSDVIITFGGRHPRRRARAADKPPVARGRRIWFDVSEVPKGEHVLSSELRLYRSLNGVTRRHRDASLTITVYRVSRRRPGPARMHYVDSTRVTADREGWITFNVTRMLRYWVNHLGDNRGLMLDIRRSDQPQRKLRPEAIGITGVRGVPDKRPFMVGFFKTSGTPFRKRGLDGTFREKRSEARSRNLLHAKTFYANVKTYRNAQTCDVRTLYVNFRDLNWQDWIIAPTGYDARYCGGECNYPFNSQTTATNHAVVQMLIHLSKPDEIPKPCCAPTKHSALSVLYFLDESNVMLRKYENMVVDKCGCQ